MNNIYRLIKLAVYLFIFIYSVMRFVVKPMIYLIKRATGKLENNDTSKSRENQEKGKKQKKSERPWNIVLDVKENATNDEIKAAYKRKIVSYHPDKLSSLGDEYRALAEEDSKEINKAYQEIKEQRGF
ncbi:DnaJ domain-containing protein [Novacetimonas hansenii]